MPAIYAHDRFGEKVAKKLDGELKRFVFEYYPQFEIESSRTGYLLFLSSVYEKQSCKIWESFTWNFCETIF